jgi:hypothetical protein
MLVERLKEEKSQLRMEMKNFLMFYLETILPSLREKKVSINTRIGTVVGFIDRVFVTNLQ